MGWSHPSSVGSIQGQVATCGTEHIVGDDEAQGCESFQTLEQYVGG